MKDKNQNQIGDINKKVSSIEWLIKEISSILGPIETKPMQDILLMDAMKQAKQMHKDEIKNAWASDRQYVFYDSDKDELSDHTIDELTEQYYNGTFGQSIADKH